MELKVIAYARNGHSDKFGIPRQSRAQSPIETRIVFTPDYRIHEALRGLEGFSHLWLLWGFSEVDSWSPTVRPPRLGGNKRMGVFATRSPFRPNPIGLSSVELVRIEQEDLIVRGADVLDGTPIYDIKPYLPFSDSHPQASCGFAQPTQDRILPVFYDLQHANDVRTVYPAEKTIEEITYILSQDPRPGYQDDPAREYKMDYDGWTVTFCVRNEQVWVVNIKKQEKKH